MLGKTSNTESGITAENYKNKLDTPEKKQKFFNHIAFDVQQNNRMPFEYFIVQPTTIAAILFIYLCYYFFGDNAYLLTESMLESLPAIVIAVFTMFKFNYKRKSHIL